MKRIIFMVATAFLVVACGGPDSNEATESQENNSQSTEGQQNGEDEVMNDEVISEPQNITLNLYTVGEQMNTMTYEPGRLEVPPGANVTIKLMNKAKSEAMIHNAVIIEAGKQEAVSEAALSAGPDMEYIPESPYIIAATGLAKPGEEVEVTFKAPEKKGTYQFICTYPGHTAMKGIFLVK